MNVSHFVKENLSLILEHGVVHTVYYICLSVCQNNCILVLNFTVCLPLVVNKRINKINKLKVLRVPLPSNIF